MKASELRIGNYISLGPFIYDNWYEVDGEILAEFAKEGCDPYKPIPLTEEWLVKFGFVDNELPNKRFEYLISPHDGEFLFRRVGLDIIYDVNIEYVHQLQNLYFALTGEELTIKE